MIMKDIQRKSMQCILEEFVMPVEDTLPVSTQVTQFTIYRIEAVNQFREGRI